MLWIYDQVIYYVPMSDLIKKKKKKKKKKKGFDRANCNCQGTIVTK
jgi:hypothetical protein